MESKDDGKRRWSDFKPREQAVILFVLDGAKILLIDKKRGLGHGKVNGPGGRLEPAETPYQAAVRETAEEVGLLADQLTERALLQFVFTNGYTLEVTVFTTESYSGEMTETDEARPFWCERSEIPYDRMWADDRIWLPRVLAGEYVCGQFIFDDDVMLQSAVFGRSPPVRSRD
jgi:8-oxo-dGTP diphosphatase